MNKEFLGRVLGQLDGIVRRNWRTAPAVKRLDTPAVRAGDCSSFTFIGWLAAGGGSKAALNELSRAKLEPAFWSYVRAEANARSLLGEEVIVALSNLRRDFANVMAFSEIRPDHNMPLCSAFAMRPASPQPGLNRRTA
jgi:hypothetical protein